MKEVWVTKPKKAFFKKKMSRPGIYFHQCECQCVRIRRHCGHPERALKASFFSQVEIFIKQIFCLIVLLDSFPTLFAMFYLGCKCTYHRSQYNLSFSFYPAPSDEQKIF